jgi:ATP-dependent RNA helicase DeaD
MTPDPSDDAITFADLALAPELVGVLSALGYEEPTPIQREAIPPLLDGKDLLGQAATGTGKTAAFALPLLERLQRSGALGGKHPTALVLVPTRELATQVSEAIHKYGRDLGVRVLPIYGGQPIVRQLKALERVVATPGRALDHIGRKTLKLEHLSTVILDEADEMLDMGFAEDIEAILSETSPERQTILFSATMPPRINRMVDRHLREPIRIQIGSEQQAAGEPPLVRQSAYIVPRAHKPAALGRILDVEQPTAAIVFCRTRAEVDSLTESLNGRGYRAEALHGGMTQDQRSRVLTRLKAYVHRIGRVGRAGREGVAITFAQPREHRMLKTIERVTRTKIAIEKVPTVADLRARRLELTRAALQESITEDDLEPFRVVVETLSDEHDIVEIALAAIKLAHEAGGGSSDEDEIPQMAPPPARERTGPGAGPRGGSGPRGDRPAGRPGGAGRPREVGEGMTRLFVGAGRTAGIRPQDLVGAIANESGLSGRQIGAIEIADRFSLVEVPEGSADHVVSTLRTSTIKGKKTTVRRERFGAKK